MCVAKQRYSFTAAAVLCAVRESSKAECVQSTPAGSGLALMPDAANESLQATAGCGAQSYHGRDNKTDDSTLTVDGACMLCMHQAVVLHSGGMLPELGRCEGSRQEL